jgi:GT2 family glycosyltransferase
VTDVTVAAVICAYTEDRWGDLQAACRSVHAQTRPVDELVVVIDHNDALLQRARAELTGALVVPSQGPRGLSGARNTGVDVTSARIVLFLDDDATAEPRWAEELVAAMSDPDVVGAGGAVVPSWRGGGRPGWFPEAFLWVVGCTYEGSPSTVAEIRNPIGASMAFDRAALELGGGFSSQIGRIGSHPVGCEETELAIRVRRARPGSRILQVPSAVVHHTVTRQRTTLGYFVRRCWWEGRSKAIVARVVGQQDTLSSESRYVVQVLPLSVLRGLRAAASGDPSGLGRAAAVLLGLLVTMAGYARGLAELRRSPAAAAPPTATTGVWCGQLDLATSSPDGLARGVDVPSGATSARVLLRCHGEPLGFVTVARGDGRLPARRAAGPPRRRRARAAGRALRDREAPVGSAVPPCRHHGTLPGVARGRPSTRERGRLHPGQTRGPPGLPARAGGAHLPPPRGRRRGQRSLVGGDR